MEEGWSCSRDRQGKTLDRIGKIGDIKKPQGGRVSNLRSFNNQTTIYDPDANPIIAQRKTMALIGGGGDYGGIGEVPTHPISLSAPCHPRSLGKRAPTPGVLLQRR
jgi:hypothetical protein